MKYATICSGINAPAVAWNSLGWQEQFCAEIEPFPCSVLSQRYPEIPNLGDITKYEKWPDFGIDLLSGGTPCQSFSLAGLRKGMDDPRGQLTRAFIGIAARYRPRWVVWENVPGVFSADEGTAFGGFLEGLTGRKIPVPPEGWGNFGIVPGIEDAYGIAWRLLDTQFVRVDTHPHACPQRRERVFVVGHLGGLWQRAAAVLLERESLCGNPAPCRKTGKGIAAGIAPSLTGSGRGVPRPGDSRGQDPIVPVATTIGCRGNRSHSELDGHGAHVVSHIAQVAPTMGNGGAPYSKTGNERVETEALCVIPIQEIGKRHSGTPMNGVGYGDAGDPMYTLQASAEHGIAIVPEVARCDATREGQSQDYETTTILPVAPPIIDASYGRLQGQSNQDGNLGHPHLLPVAFAQNTRDEVRLMNGDGAITGALAAEAGMKQQNYVAFQPRIARNGHGNMSQGVVHALQASATGASDAAPHVASGTAVRRLTPTECCRLQGFPDDYLDVIHNGKPAKDGPKYKALGNAMSVNVKRWLGQRIDMVDSIPF